MKSKEVLQAVSIVLTYAGGAVLAYVAIRVFVMPVTLLNGISSCGIGGAPRALLDPQSGTYECKSATWLRLGSTLPWACLGVGMLLASLRVRRDVIGSGGEA